MSDDKKKPHDRDEGFQCKARLKKAQDERENDISDKSKELFPAISLALNMVNLSHNNQDKDESDDVRIIKEDKQLDPDRRVLRERLQEKLEELLEEQHALIDLYIKAAKAAKEKEEEYKERISELVEQTEKDKQLMDIFRSI